MCILTPPFLDFVPFVKDAITLHGFIWLYTRYTPYMNDQIMNRKTEGGKDGQGKFDGLSIAFKC